MQQNSSQFAGEFLKNCSEIFGEFPKNCSEFFGEFSRIARKICRQFLKNVRTILRQFLKTARTILRKFVKCICKFYCNFRVKVQMKRKIAAQMSRKFTRNFPAILYIRIRKRKKEIRMRERFQKKALPGVAVRPGRVRFAPRPRRHGICRQADDTTAIGGRGGVIYFRGILSRGIIHKNMRFGEYDFVRYFFRKLLLFRYIWCIIQVERYPRGGIRRVIHRVRN